VFNVSLFSNDRSVGVSDLGDVRVVLLPGGECVSLNVNVRGFGDQSSDGPVR